MRAGYYVQFYDSIPAYGSGLKTAARSGLDSFFANSKVLTKTAGNAPVLAEAVTLIDSSDRERPLPARGQVAAGLPTSPPTPELGLQRRREQHLHGAVAGHQNADYKTAVQNDTTVVDAIYQFTLRNQSLLAPARATCPSNGAREMARFLQYSGQKTAPDPRSRTC